MSTSKLINGSLTANTLNLRTIGGTTSIGNLGIDSNGNVVSGYTGNSGDTSPISVVNTSSLFSTGLSNTGINASGVTYSNFIGGYAGYQATGASNSNFFG